MLYNEKIFNDLCRKMGLQLDEHPDYDAAIERMKTFYPVADETLELSSFSYSPIPNEISSTQITEEQKCTYTPTHLTLEAA